MADRIAKLQRKTKETDIAVTLNIDGTGKSQIQTGIGFFDHMLEGFSKHGFFDLDLSCDGDLVVDSHHTIEDCGIVLGNAIREAIGDKNGIRRFVSCIFGCSDKKGGYKVKATEAKMARGSMVRWCAEHNVQSPEEVQAFATYGYSFRPELSTETDYIFIK